MNDPRVIRMGEFFSGPGGIALGADLASKASQEYSPYQIVHEWANDFDREACETYCNNIAVNPEGVYCEDVKKLNLDKLTQIDAFCFGFPCNDFSKVGKQKGFDGDFGPLYTYGVNVLKKFQPDWFIAENVSGLKNLKEGKDFNCILSDLYDAGYDLFPNTYYFEKYGIPQARHRIIIVGFRKDLDLKFKIPAPTGVIKTCKEAIEVPPIPEDAMNNERINQRKKVIERLSYIKPGQNAFNADIPERLQLHVKGAKISQIYRRLDPDKPSYTITGSGGGGTHVYHWSENRALTNRERARLQTFPDSYVFHGRKEDVRKQIGMAVPPEGAKIIFEGIFKTLSGIDYPSVEPTFPVQIHSINE